MTLPILQPSDFFGIGVSKVNDALAELLTIAQTARGTDIDSGICAPVVMAMGADNQHWIIPEGVVGAFWVLDHGMVLPETEYSVVDGEIVLGYVPGLPYNLAIAWSATKNGVVPPVTLTQHPSLGDRYWVLPDGYGVNVLVFDYGRLLRRDQYQVKDGIVILNYTPLAPYKITASWGSGSPGLLPPRAIDLVVPGSLDLVHLQLPPDFGPGVLITDHGFILDSTDYSYNTTTGVVTLNYVPTEPLDIAATWGLRLEGVFVTGVSASPAPDGVVTAFMLANAPVTDTLQLSARLLDGSIEYYVNHVDYDVIGRNVYFKNGTVPPDESVLVADMMSVIVDFGKSAANATDPDVVIERGESVNISPYTTVWTRNPDGSLAQVEIKLGAVTVKTYQWTYNGDGTLATTIESGGGNTVTVTFQYDGNGNVVGSSTVVT